MRRNVWAGLVLLAAVCVIFAGCKKFKKGTEKKIQTSAETKIAVDFTLKDQNGNTVNLSDFDGKIVVLEWLNYDCPFVLPHYEKGEMEAMAQKYKDDGVVWVAINSTHYADSAKNKEFSEKYSLSYPILDDKDGKIGRIYGATNTPHIFIIKEGGIVYQGAFDNAHGGKVPDKYEGYVDDALTALIEGREVAVDSTKAVGCTVKYAQ